jgi:hypothetical protein
MFDQIDLYGWDTVFAINYKQANQAIKTAKSTPQSFAYNDSTSNVHINGKWDDWQLTSGGDGQNLQLRCPVVSGTVTHENNTFDLKNSVLQIQIRLSKVPDPAARFNDPSAKSDTGIPIRLLTNTISTNTDPAVSVLSAEFPEVSDSLLKEALPGVFSAYFNTHITDFSHTFSILIVNEQADKQDYQWLKPTDLSYACKNAADGSLDKSVFAVLCMTDNHPIGINEHAIDNRILQVVSKDANSAFGISDTQVLKHLFAPGAVAVIQGSKLTDFNITNDNLTILNNRDITWGNFQLESGEIVRPVIKAGRFQMTLQSSQVNLQITDAAFNWPKWHGPGDIKVRLTLNQFFEFDLKPNGKGGYVFVPKGAGPGVKDITATVSASKDVQIFDICMGIAGSLVGAVLGGLLGAAFDAGAAVTVVDTRLGRLAVNAEDLQEAIGKVNKNQLVQEDQTVAMRVRAYLVDANSPTWPQKFRGAFWGNKWKLLGGILGTLSGMQLGLIAEYVQLTAQGKLDKVPPFNTFAAKCIGATQWPEAKGWELKSAALRGPLIIGGKLTGKGI